MKQLLLQNDFTKTKVSMFIDYPAYNHMKCQKLKSSHKIPMKSISYPIIRIKT